VNKGNKESGEKRYPD